MGIKFLCPNGHKLHVKSFLASQRGVCPHCAEKFIVPAQSLPDIRVESIGVKRDRRRIEADREIAAMERAGQDPAVATMAKNGEIVGTDRTVTSISGVVLSDPISEAPAAVWYVRINDGNQFGPAPADMMRRWLEEGRVTADSLVWREGWAEWGVAGRLFPQLSRPLDPPEIGPSAFAAFEQGLAEQVETLVPPAAIAADAGALVDEGRPIKSSSLAARRTAKQRSKLALIALVVAIVCLLPVFFFVLMQQ
jgi:hypothetical protein